MRLPTLQNLDFGKVHVLLYEFNKDPFDDLIAYEAGYNHPVILVRVSLNCSQLSVARVMASFLGGSGRIDSLWIYDHEQHGYVRVHTCTGRIAYGMKFIPEGELVQRAA